MNYLWKRISSFGFALKGIKVLLSEPNFRIHIVAFVLVLPLSFYFNISKTEWIFIITISAFVMITEAINTAIEKTLDFISLESNPKIGLIKDISAGFVLMAAICAIIVGGIIFLPKIYLLFV